jgi:sulfur relay (sulfurtransferase) DsrC/TusE family protein
LAKTAAKKEIIMEENLWNTANKLRTKDNVFYLPEKSRWSYIMKNAKQNDIAIRLTADYGKGFTVTNLKYMRQFYTQFPIRHALRDDCLWIKYDWR